MKGDYFDNVLFLAYLPVIAFAVTQYAFWSLPASLVVARHASKAVRAPK